MPRKCQHQNYSCGFICTCECGDCSSDEPKRRKLSKSDRSTDLAGLIGLGIIGGVALDIFN